jgi:hypothetical protein
LLTDSQVCAANTLEGLNLVLWHVCVTRGCEARGRPQPGPAGFFESFRGYLLKEMIASLQAVFAEELGWIADGGGCSSLRPRNGAHW